MKRDGVTFIEACRHLGTGEPPRRGAERRPASQPTVAPEPAPSSTWQAAADAYVAECERTLWTPTAERARAWLHARGLADDTLKAWRVGYCAADHYGNARDWDAERDVSLPRGIVVPWTQDGHMWAIKVRLPTRPPARKYHSVAGSRMDVVYGNHTIESHKPLVLLESELDVVLLHQDAGDLVAAGSLNGTRTDFTRRMLLVLRKAHPIFIAYDADDAGQKAARRIIEHGPRFRPVRWPDGVKDLADLAPAGYAVRMWVEHHLADVRRPAVSVSDLPEDATTVNVENGTTTDAYAEIEW